MFFFKLDACFPSVFFKVMYSRLFDMWTRKNLSNRSWGFTQRIQSFLGLLIDFRQLSIFTCYGVFCWRCIITIPHEHASTQFGFFRIFLIFKQLNLKTSMKHLQRKQILTQASLSRRKVIVLTLRLKFSVSKYCVLGCLMMISFDQHCQKQL